MLTDFLNEHFAVVTTLSILLAVVVLVVTAWRLGMLHQQWIDDQRRANGED